MPWPTELRYDKAGKVLSIRFDDGAHYHLSAELLRVASPSAEVRGHSPDQRVLVTGARDVGIESIEPVGNYAVRLLFDDSHGTGIYSWAYLAELGENQAEIWRKYLADLDSAGKSRDG